MKLTRLQFILAGFLFWCGFFVLPVFSQIQTKDFEVVSNPATVGGTVSTEGKAAANISIGVTKASANWNDKPEATTKPDTDGKFLLENLPAGSYYLRPEVPGFVFPDEKDARDFGQEGKQVVLAAGSVLIVCC